MSLMPLLRSAGASTHPCPSLSVSGAQSEASQASRLHDHWHATGAGSQNRACWSCQALLGDGQEMGMVAITAPEVSVGGSEGDVEGAFKQVVVSSAPDGRGGAHSVAPNSLHSRWAGG